MPSIIIAGTRTFNNKLMLYDCLNNLPKDWLIEEVICGECEGADLLGKQWAEEHKIPVRSFPAQWKQFGLSAGYIRNKEMAKEAEALVAFWDGESKGTNMIIRLMKNMKKPTMVIMYKNVNIESV